MARKFQIGDTVQVVPGAWDDPGEFKVGHVGKVVDYVFGKMFPYEVKRKNGNYYDFSARELKLIKRKTETKNKKK